MWGRGRRELVLNLEQLIEGIAASAPCCHHSLRLTAALLLLLLMCVVRRVLVCFPAVFECIAVADGHSEQNLLSQTVCDVSTNCVSICGICSSRLHIL